MSGVDLLLWVVLPYVSLAIFIAGHIWRYRRDQFTWTTRSTQLVERRLLRWGSVLFHYGLLAVFGGHVLGILVPESATAAVGISEDTYHVVSVSAGTVSGLVCVAGFLILMYRRITVLRVAATTTRVDIATYVLLALVIGLGMGETIGVNLFGGGYDYRATVAVWFRGIFLLDPHGALMAGAPLVYQMHVTAAWLLFALWPFSRLVHAWSVPFTYLGRAHILYRSKRQAGHDWQRAYVPTSLQPWPRRRR
jgi:nitrate reductase gamma subunit